MILKMKKMQDIILLSHLILLPEYILSFLILFFFPLHSFLSFSFSSIFHLVPSLFIPISLPSFHVLFFDTSLLFLSLSSSLFPLFPIPFFLPLCSSSFCSTLDPLFFPFYLIGLTMKSIYLAL